VFAGGIRRPDLKLTGRTIRASTPVDQLDPLLPPVPIHAGSSASSLLTLASIFAGDPALSAGACPSLGPPHRGSKLELTALDRSVEAAGGRDPFLRIQGVCVTRCGSWDTRACCRTRPTGFFHALCLLAPPASSPLVPSFASPGKSRAVIRAPCAEVGRAQRPTSGTASLGGGRRRTRRVATSGSRSGYNATRRAGTPGILLGWDLDCRGSRPAAISPCSPA